MKWILVVFWVAVAFLPSRAAYADETLSKCLEIVQIAKPTKDILNDCVEAGKAHWLYPKDRSRAYTALSAAYVRLGNYKKAKASANLAIHRDDENVTAHYYKAYVSFVLQQYRDADASSLKAIELWPTFAKAHSIRTSTLLALARYPEALSSGLKVIEIEPKNSSAYANVSLALITVGNYESSVKYGLHAVMLNPKLAFGHAYLAVARAFLGDDKMAQESISTAIKLQSKWGLIWAMAGVVHNRGGRFKESTNAFNEAVRLYPEMFGTNKPAYYLAFRIAKEASQKGHRVGGSGTGAVAVENKIPDSSDGKKAGAQNEISTPSNGSSSALEVELLEKPLAVRFKKVAPRPDDIAVIIGNANYAKLSRDVPNVIPAYSDAASFKKYALEALGVKEGNIIYLRDATRSQLVRVFGSTSNSRGQLFDWVRPSRSNVFVFYSGHGAPDPSSGESFLVPSDADSSRLSLTGYPLSLLYKNLGQVPARSITVILESCFSGLSSNGPVISGMSGLTIEPKGLDLPSYITVVSAGKSDQIASWEQDNSNGLFTKYLLLALSGEADATPYGNADGEVDWNEVSAYFQDTLTYMARRYYGRNQTAQIRQATK